MQVRLHYLKLRQQKDVDDLLLNRALQTSSLSTVFLLCTSLYFTMP